MLYKKAGGARALVFVPSTPKYGCMLQAGGPQLNRAVSFYFPKVALVHRPRPWSSGTSSTSMSLSQGKGVAPQERDIVKENRRSSLSFKEARPKFVRRCHLRRAELVKPAKVHKCSPCHQPAGGAWLPCGKRVGGQVTCLPCLHKKQGMSKDIARGAVKYLRGYLLPSATPGRLRCCRSYSRTTSTKARSTTEKEQGHDTAPKPKRKTAVLAGSSSLPENLVRKCRPSRSISHPSRIFEHLLSVCVSS